MAVLIMDGFEAYGTSGNPTNMPHSGWTVNTVSDFTIVDGVFSGKALSCDVGGGSRWVRTPYLGANVTMVVGCWVYLGTPNGDRAMIELFDGDAALGMNLQILSTGEIRVRRNTTNIESTTTVAALQGTWVHLEWKVVVHASAGSYDLKINGVTVANNGGSTLDTQAQAGSNAGHHSYVALNCAAPGTIYDHLQVNDNDFLGPLVVVTLFPDAAGDDADFTPSSGNNYQAVDETPSDGDSTYVESSTTNHQDLHGFPAPADIGTVVAVQQTVVARVTTGTPHDLKLVCKSGSTEDVDAPQTVSSPDFTGFRQVLEDDPDTSAAWADAAAIGAAQFGYRVG